MHGEGYLLPGMGREDSIGDGNVDDARDLIVRFPLPTGMGDTPRAPGKRSMDGPV